jgi:hypothetical protein
MRQGGAVSAVSAETPITASLLLQRRAARRHVAPRFDAQQRRFGRSHMFSICFNNNRTKGRPQNEPPR